MKFHSIEGLRAYMAWWVVIGHALNLAGAGNNGFLQQVPASLLSLLERGGTAVHVFIIVSGFVITHLLMQKRGGYASYIGRRFFRLFPIYALCIILSLATLSLYELAYLQIGFADGHAMRVDRFAEQQGNIAAHVALHASLLHGIVPNEVLPYASTTILAPTWSLSLEWQFYLIAPALVGMMLWSARIALLSALILTALQYFLMLGQDKLHWEFQAFFGVSAVYFACGILCRFAIERLCDRRLASGLLMLFVALGSTLLFDRYAFAIWAVWLLVLLYEAGWLGVSSPHLRAAVRQVTMAGWLCSLGRWSYSTYLVHIPLFVILVGGYAMVKGAENVSQAEIGVIMALSMPLLLGLSALLYRLVEQPGIALGRRLLGSRKVKLVPAHP